MGETLIFKVATHAGIEALGGIGVGCLLLICEHDHLRGRLAFVRALARSRAYRASVIGLFYLLTSVATVALIDREIFTEGLVVFGLAVALHVGLEVLGGASLMALVGRGGRALRARLASGAGALLDSRAAQLTLLGVWYLAISVVTVLLIPLGH